MKLDLPPEQREALRRVVDAVDEKLSGAVAEVYPLGPTFKKLHDALLLNARICAAIAKADRATTKPAKGAKKS